MVEPKKCSFYSCEAEAIEENPRGFCSDHSQKDWYTVKEAARIWGAGERTVRDWIRTRGLVTAERVGLRTYHIPAEEFAKPRPSERLRLPELLQQAPLQEPSKSKRHVSWLAAIGAALTTLVIAIVGIISLGSSTDPEENGATTEGAASGGSAALSIRFDRWNPEGPVLVKVSEEVALEVEYTNTSEVASDVYAAVSLRDPDGDWVDIRPLRRVHLKPGESGTASWTHSVGRKGSWDVVHGIWGHWEEGQEPQHALGNTGILKSHIVAFQECADDSALATPVTIVGYTPFQSTDVTAGEIANLSVTLANIGDTPQTFVAGATIWDAEGNIIPNGDYETMLDRPLAPGESATVHWEHTAVAPGSYQLQFAVWNETRSRMLVRAPCPREKLIVAHELSMPAVAGVEPAQPQSQPTRQWLTITGENFTEDSVVVLSILGNIYTISKERTEFISPSELRVFVGLTDPGSWTVQVINPGDLRSNVLEFKVLP